MGTRHTACRSTICQTCVRSAIPAHCAQRSQNPLVLAIQACLIDGAPLRSIQRTRQWVLCCAQPCRRYVLVSVGVEARRGEGSRVKGESKGRSRLAEHVDALSVYSIAAGPKAKRAMLGGCRLRVGELDLQCCDAGRVQTIEWAAHRAGQSAAKPAFSVSSHGLHDAAAWHAGGWHQFLFAVVVFNLTTPSPS